jgi:hypothetical protein
MDSRAEECLREQEQLASARAVWEQHWRECAERVDPINNYFQNQTRTDGEKRNEKIFDDTAPAALPKFVACVISVAMPANQEYQKLIIQDEEFTDNAEVERFYEKTIKVLFRHRYSAKSKFQDQVASVIKDVGLYGTGIMFVDDMVGGGIRYKSLALHQCYISEDAYGMVDTLHRKFQWTAHQAATKFGEDKLPENMRACLKTDPNKKFWFLHCVKPNKFKVAQARDYRGMDYWSCYISVDEGRKIIDEGGFRVFPFAVVRAETSSSEVYGRSRVMRVLPSIKTANEMMKTILRAGQLVVQPPIMLSDDGSLQAFNLRPNALNFGAIDDQGRDRVKAFNTGGKPDFGEELLMNTRKVIDDALFVTLFNILKDGPSITATQAMLEAQEKGQLLFPEVGRIQNELLSALTDRELDILAHSNQLPEMPQILKDYYYNGGEHHIEYNSPLNQAQAAGQGVAILNTIQAIAPLAQIDASVLHRFDLDAMASMLAKSNGLPASLIKSDEEVDAKKQEDASQQQMQQLLAAAPVAASSAKDFAQASALSASAPSQQLPNLGLG